MQQEKWIDRVLSVEPRPVKKSRAIPILLIIGWSGLVFLMAWDLYGTNIALLATAIMILVICGLAASMGSLAHDEEDGVGDTKELGGTPGIDALISKVPHGERQG
jgi:hypothetical protein